MRDIVTFLTAELDEDERIALATTACPVAGSWRGAQEKHSEDWSPLALIQGREEIDTPDYIGYSPGRPVIVHAADWQHEAEDNLRHIARHDPARVLAEVAVKREILSSYVAAKAQVESRLEASDGVKPTDLIASATLGALETIVRDLATVYADRPGYKAEWRID